MKCLCVPKLTQLCTIHELTSWNHPRLAPRNLLIVFSFENLDPNRVLGLLSEDAYTRSRVYYTLSKRAGQQQREGRCSKTHEIGPTLTHIRSLWARAGARARQHPRVTRTGPDAHSTNDRPNDRLLGSREATTTATGRWTILGTVAASPAFCCRI